MRFKSTRIQSMAAVFLAVGGALYFTSTTAQSQTSLLKENVALQGVSPGFSQSGNSNISGTARAGQFVGGGTGLTNLSASSIASGTLSDARLSTNVVLKNGTNTFTAVNQFSANTLFSSFVGVNRTSGQISANESFGIGQSAASFDGMYVRTAATGKPFYGYSLNGAVSAYHYFDSADSRFKLFIGGQTPLTVANNELKVNGVLVANSMSLMGLGTVTGNHAGSQGLFTITNSGASPALYVSNSATGTTYGVHSIVQGSGLAVWGESTSNGTGVKGTSSSGMGVYGTTNSGIGVLGEGTYGVAGVSSTASGYGVLGEFLGSAGPGYGVFGQNNSADGHGVFGRSTAQGGIGVEGLSAHSLGIGVKGDSNEGKGVYGISVTGMGVAGYAVNGIGGVFQGPTGISVSGTSAGSSAISADSPSGYGITASSVQRYAVNASSSNQSAIYGASTNNDGIIGRTYLGGKSSIFGYTDAQNANGGYFNSANATGGGHGVIGQSSSATGNGVYSLGRFAATGTKSFQIDHPFDPENKYLIHYCTEGPEPLNTYSGSIVTDAKGKAWVELPDYFDEINKEPRVQLTVDDDTDDIVIAKVAGGVQPGGFRIRTNKPGVKVYWEVKAVRNDRFVRKNGAPVEPDKPETERGTYLHPELFGVSKERGLYNRSVPESEAPSARQSIKR